MVDVKTHSPPKENIALRCHFLLVETWRLHTGSMGKTSTTMSVMRLIIAIDISWALEFMHVPLIVESQSACIGIHLNISAKTRAMV